jgi:23S rRNA (cytosine1962-C5)-methyltransferase
LFCYSGSFGIGALAGGAKKAVFVDSSRPACALIRRHLALNRLEETRAEVVNSNVFRYLARLEKENREFDLIVVDPPAFATMKKDLTRAARAYLFLNQTAFRLLREGGLLATFSCSHHVGAKLFDQIAWEAALQAERSARVLFRFHHCPDHPVSVYHPEGDYLKGLLLRVD